MRKKKTFNSLCLTGSVGEHIVFQPIYFKYFRKFDFYACFQRGFWCNLLKTQQSTRSVNIPNFTLLKVKRLHRSTHHRLRWPLTHAVFQMVVGYLLRTHQVLGCPLFHSLSSCGTGFTWNKGHLAYWSGFRRALPRWAVMSTLTLHSLKQQVHYTAVAGESSLKVLLLLLLHGRADDVAGFFQVVWLDFLRSAAADSPQAGREEQRAAWPVDLRVGGWRGGRWGSGQRVAIMQGRQTRAAAAEARGSPVWLLWGGAAWSHAIVQPSQWIRVHSKRGQVTVTGRAWWQFQKNWWLLLWLLSLYRTVNSFNFTSIVWSDGQISCTTDVSLN